MAIIRLARSTTWDVLASSALLSTSNGVSGPSPSRARSASAKNVDVGSGRGDGTLDILDSETGDGDTGSGSASWGSVLVILLDDDTVLGNAGEGDVLVGYALDGSSGAVDGLDTDTVLGVLDCAGGDGYVLV